MKLNISCVRDILLTVEKYEQFHDPVIFDSDYPDYHNDYLSAYSTDEVFYHVQYCIKAGLLYDSNLNFKHFKTRFVCGMEPNGHNLLSNIRTEENWTWVQKILSKLGDASLSIIAATAEGVATALMNKYLKEELSDII